MFLALHMLIKHVDTLIMEDLFVVLSTSPLIFPSNLIFQIINTQFSVNGKIDFKYRDLFHKIHVNNLVHINLSRCFYKMLFKKSHRRMGMVVKGPTPIEVPKDLKCTINKDKKEVANNNDDRQSQAFSIDMDLRAIKKKTFP